MFWAVMVDKLYLLALHPPFLAQKYTFCTLDPRRVRRVSHEIIRRKSMKALRIIQSVGYFALFLASVFNLVNQIAEKQIFGLAITLPLLVIALVGIICGIILIIKNRKK